MSERWEDLVGCAEPPPAPKPPTVRRIARAPQYAGCEHTADPAGWVMDSDGNITGKCPCWQEGTTQ